MSDISKQMHDSHDELEAYEKQQTEAEKRRAEYDKRQTEEDRNRAWRTQQMFSNLISGGMPSGRMIDWSKM